MFEQLDIEMQKTQKAMEDLHSFGQQTIRTINDRHAELHKVLDSISIDIGVNDYAETNEKLSKIDVALNELLAGF